MNPVAYLPQSQRLLDHVREVLRYRHYSLKTEQAYLHWVRFFVRWHGRDGKMRHPRDMGVAQVTQFLSMLANERRVSVSTHNQALSALLFLYRNVLGVDLPWLAEVQRPTRPRRIPSVLTKTEVGALLGAMDGETALLAKLLYGTGMRFMEGLRLRVKDSAAWCDECRLPLHTNHRKYPWSCRAAPYRHETSISARAAELGSEPKSVLPFRRPRMPQPELGSDPNSAPIQLRHLQGLGRWSPPISGPFTV